MGDLSRRLAGPVITFLLALGFQVSGLESLPVAIALWVLALLWFVWFLVSRFLTRRSKEVTSDRSEGDHRSRVAGPAFERREHTVKTEHGSTTAWEETRRGQDAIATPKTVEAKASIPTPTVIVGPPEDWDKEGWWGSFQWQPIGGPNVVLRLHPPEGTDDPTLVCEVQDPEGDTAKARQVSEPGSLIVQDVPDETYRCVYPMSFFDKGKQPDHLPNGWHTVRWYSTHHRAGREVLSIKHFRVTEQGGVE